jgi:hypothetical protein
MLSKLQYPFPNFSSKNSSQLHCNCFKVTAWFSTTCSACYCAVLCCAVLVSCSAYLLTVKMEVTYSSETSIDFKQTARLYVSEGITLHNHRCENLESYIYVKVIFFQYDPKLYSFKNFNAEPYNSKWLWIQNVWTDLTFLVLNYFVHFLQRMYNKEQQRRNPYMLHHWLS